ncbi:nucleoside hydrolase [Pararhodobacter aggregans]|uniref:Nucleoside hydrolase n=1 Tax=Pararhodobacter aggregans TaxID=404875 RepID=A0A2T7USC8_9RHOB|nr:nucleoside hydrolase [Pararhodobacter aggregans]PTX00163.1 purine nucleosidase/non-specific riboncleoside hydrolase [Pararhodobacter aggregans]PVE47491.1 nucleoside hydrolase [Pararhodobacter aggregans]
MRNRLILDTDGGVDDAQALLMLIAAGHVPDAVTTVFGNVDLDTATGNILSVLAHGGVPEVPVHKGAAAALINPPIAAREIHGEDGLGGAPRPATLPEPAGEDAVGFLIAELRAAIAGGRKVDLMMIGPLTNLALVLRQAPECAAGVGRLVIMGGTIDGRGNVTPAAEFNIYADPEAAQIVLTAGLDCTLVPWEACADNRMPGDQVAALFAGLPDGDLARFSAALSAHAMRVIKGFTGKEYFRFVDPLAAAVLIDPGIVTDSLKASLAVSLAPGLTRGMVVVDPSGRLGTPPVTLVRRCDLARVIALYSASVSA